MSRRRILWTWRRPFFEKLIEYARASSSVDDRHEMVPIKFCRNFNMSRRRILWTWRRPFFVKLNEMDTIVTPVDTSPSLQSSDEVSNWKKEFLYLPSRFRESAVQFASHYSTTFTVSGNLITKAFPYGLLKPNTPFLRPALSRSLTYIHLPRTMSDFLYNSDGETKRRELVYELVIEVELLGNVFVHGVWSGFIDENNNVTHTRYSGGPNPIFKNQAKEDWENLDEEMQKKITDIWPVNKENQQIKHSRFSFDSSMEGNYYVESFKLAYPYFYGEKQISNVLKTYPLNADCGNIKDFATKMESHIGVKIRVESREPHKYPDRFTKFFPIPNIVHNKQKPKILTTLGILFNEQKTPINHPNAPYANQSQKKQKAPVKSQKKSKNQSKGKKSGPPFFINFS